MRGQLNISGKIASEILDLCLRQNPIYRPFAYRAVSTNYFYEGDFIESQKYAKLGIIKYTNIDQALINAQFDVNEPVLSCIGYVGLCSWFLGEPDKAKKIAEETYNKSKKLDHMHTLVVALFIKTLIYLYRMDKEESVELSKELIQLSSDYGFALWKIAGEIIHGWAIDNNEGILEIDEGIKRWETTGARLFSPFWRALLAEQYLKFKKSK